MTPQPPAASGNRGRFLVVYAILGVAVAAAIAGVALYTGRAVDPAPAWSSWRPSGGGLGAAKQIAAQVAPKYRLPDGTQLDDPVTTATALSSNGRTVPIPFIAVRGAQGKIDVVSPISPDNSLTYSLCGFGAACSIASGKPTPARGILVRREILELALYTFKYVHNIDHVVAFIPPVKGKPQYVVYLQRNDVARFLSEPLARTLSSDVPLATQLTPGEAVRIDKLTRPFTYRFGVTQTPQGDAIYVLTPLKPLAG